MPPFHLNRTSDLSLDELDSLLAESKRVAERVRTKTPEPSTPMRDQMALWLSTKDSFRTASSIQAAVTRLGGNVMPYTNLLSSETKEMREPLAHLVGCADAMGYRVAFARLHTQQQTLEMIGASKNMAIINALNDKDHPLQSFADAAALEERTGVSKGKKVVFMGPGNNNVTVSLAEVAAMRGWEFIHTGPQGHRIPEDRFEELQELARKGGGSVRYVEDWSEAVPDATMVYTDVHASMGQKDQATQLKKMLAGYKLTQAVMDRAGPQALIGHCLPAEDAEIDVHLADIDHPQSIIYPIAGYRAHTATALLRMIAEGKLKAR